MTPRSPTLFLASGEVLLALQKFLLRATTLGQPWSVRARARDLEEDQSNYRAWAALQIPVAWMEIRSFFL